jgi:hypothetical protein
MVSLPIIGEQQAFGYQAVPEPPPSTPIKSKMTTNSNIPVKYQYLEILSPYMLLSCKYEGCTIKPIEYQIDGYALNRRPPRLGKSGRRFAAVLNVMPVRLHVRRGVGMAMCNKLLKTAPDSLHGTERALPSY